MTAVSLLVALGGLCALIVIHELAHFIAARLCGMRPRRFYLFFGPAIVRFQHNGVEYGLGTIPFGGYVKIPGMHRPRHLELGWAFDGALLERPEATAAVDQLLSDLRRERCSEAMAGIGRVRAELQGLTKKAQQKVDEALEEIADAAAPGSYWSAPVWRRVIVVAAGPFVNLLLAFVLMTAVVALESPGRPGATVASVVAGSPAAYAHVHAGDLIVAVDGQKTDDSNALGQVIDRVGHRQATVTVDRHGRLLHLLMRPMLVGGQPRLGVYVDASAPAGAGSLPAAARYSAVEIFGAARAMVAGLAGAVERTPVRRSSAPVAQSKGPLASSSNGPAIVGPIGIVQLSMQAWRAGGLLYLLVLAVISLSLAVLNMLPVPPLDGGQILFALIEGVTRRPLAREVQQAMTVFGSLAIAALLFVGLYGDLLNL